MPPLLSLFPSQKTAGLQFQSIADENPSVAKHAQPQFTLDMTKPAVYNPKALRLPGPCTPTFEKIISHSAWTVSSTPASHGSGGALTPLCERLDDHKGSAMGTFRESPAQPLSPQDKPEPVDPELLKQINAMNLSPMHGATAVCRNRADIASDLFEPGFGEAKPRKICKKVPVPTTQPQAPQYGDVDGSAVVVLSSAVDHYRRVVRSSQDAACGLFEPVVRKPKAMRR